MNSRVLLYRRITEGAGYLADLTRHLPDWQDETRAVGGFWTGHGTISETMTRLQLVDLFNTALGGVIRRAAFAQTGWEGFIYELRLTVGGVQYVRTLTPELWHNRVIVYYTTHNGDQGKTAWAEDTASMALYGTSEFIVSIGTASADGANRLLQRHLAEYAWPRTRMAGATLATPSPAPPTPDTLEIIAAGFWSTLNWRYADDIAEEGYENYIAAALALIVGKAQFVSSGRITDTPALNRVWMRIESEPPQRLGDLCELGVSHGDHSGNIWQAGVYADQKFYYDPAPTTPTHTWRQGQLCTLGGQPVCLDLLKPGFLLLNRDAPSLGLPAGTTAVRNDPRVAYVDSILFSQPGSVRLGVQETGNPADFILEQIATDSRIIDALQGRMARSRQEAQEAMRRDYARREREYINRINPLWGEYEKLTGHGWSGNYDEGL